VEYYKIVGNFIENDIPFSEAERYVYRLIRINNLKGESRRNAFYDFTDELREEYDYDWEYHRDEFSKLQSP
jgi:hypothetical protein